MEEIDITIDFQRSEFKFSGSGISPFQEDRPISFGSTIRKAEVVLFGFNCEFDGDDHPLQKLQVSAQVLSFTSNTVNIRVIYALKDNTGMYDDPFSGLVHVLVIVERD